MSKLPTIFLGISSLIVAFLFFYAISDISWNLSPQGCRMSWMSPSYVLQTNFDSTWSPLARRYSLLLYREVDWDSLQTEGLRQGSLPVLFIPGNAGSSHQIRSIASSATRQYFSSPYVVSPPFKSRPSKPLDFYAVEFNEDLSAFHGSTLESQISYTKAAISYILTMYPTNTTIIVMGHSMGGIVATSLLSSDKISVIITMSTPHTLPPARFDSRIDDLYSRLQKTLEEDSTPLVSICGGATDMMIPSESCILPRTSKPIFRRTVFTSALEGAWTGVGHREMVWCHQVRWRVARAALELGIENSGESSAEILDKWLRDGRTLPSKAIPASNSEADVASADSSELQVGRRLVLKSPNTSRLYLLPVNNNLPGQRLTVMVSQGSILTVLPEHPIPLRVSVFTCQGSPTSRSCAPLQPKTLKLIPNPVPGRDFPVPNEGSDESEGIVLFETPAPQKTGDHWIGIKVDDADGRGWVVAGLSTNKINVVGTSTFSLLFRSLSLSFLDHKDLATSFTFPNLLSHALMVYRVTPHILSTPLCTEALLPPLLMHTSSPDETHYFPLTKSSDKRILLHTHLGAPFLEDKRYLPSAVNFTIYSSDEPGCRQGFEKFSLSIDWTATMGRWASRYLTTLVSWATGVATIVVFLGWSQSDREGIMPTVEQSFSRYTTWLFCYLLPGSFVLSMIPFPEYIYLGNQGIVVLSPIAPILLFVASGLVYISWWILKLFLITIGKTAVFLFGRRSENLGNPTSTILSLVVICGAVFLFIPWQVTYIGCWLLHLYTCGSSMQTLGLQGADRASPGTTDSREIKRTNLNHNPHLLLLLTWLLPLTAPVLAVWVRTLLTAGYTTPFDGDHNFLAVLPFLILADFSSWAPGQLLNKTSSIERRVSLRWLFAIMAGTAFMYGSRKPYLTLDMARVAIWVIVIFKIGRRYWGG